MKKYIISKKGLQFLNKIEKDYTEYNNLDIVIISLTEQDKEVLISNNIEFREEESSKNCLLWDPSSAYSYTTPNLYPYEKIRSRFIKAVKSGYTGKNVKVAVLDTGLCLEGNSLCHSRIPVHISLDFTQSNPEVGGYDGYSHGTQMISIIKAPDFSGYINPTNGFRVGDVGLGLAPDCELHSLKMLDNSGFTVESWVLGALDYCLDNNIDFINCSWQFNTPAVEAAIKACISNGSVVVGAAGNSNTETYTVAPACIEGVVAVGRLLRSGITNSYNYLPPSGPGYHGISIVCSGGDLSEAINRAGNFTGTNASSPAAAFFTGVLAVTKEMTGLQDNQEVLKYVMDRAVKHPDTLRYGVGYVSF